jgi:hypothetical protein
LQPFIDIDGLIHVSTQLAEPAFPGSETGADPGFCSPEILDPGPEKSAIDP